MKRPRNTELRKQPKTAAGSAIEGAILDAAEALIAEDGLEHLTTNRAAARAGVSIGSLYQYFPSKEAIAAELVRRMERRAKTLVEDALATSREAPLEHAAGAVVDALLGESLARVPARAALRRAIPADWARPTSASVDAEVRAVLTDTLLERADVRRGPPAMVWVVAHAVELVIESAVLDAPALLTDRTFRDELVQLVVRYLRADVTRD